MINLLLYFYIGVGRTKNKKRRPTEESCCPICNEKLSGTSEELNGHVELCLKKVAKYFDR